MNRRVAIHHFLRRVEGSGVMTPPLQRHFHHNRKVVHRAIYEIFDEVFTRSILNLYIPIII